MADHVQSNSEPESKLNLEELLEGVFVGASTSKRILNYVIDTTIIYLMALLLDSVYIIIMTELIDLGIEESYLMSGFAIFNFLLAVIYYMILELAIGKSIGKMITKTRVVDELGNLPKPKQIVIRNLLRLNPFDIFSFLGSDPPRGWHDSLSKTRVVEEDSLHWVKK